MASKLNEKQLNEANGGIKDSFFHGEFQAYDYSNNEVGNKFTTENAAVPYIVQGEVFRKTAELFKNDQSIKYVKYTIYHDDSIHKADTINRP